MKKSFVLIALCTCLFSCKTALVNLLIKNPKVENTETIKAFQQKHEYPTTNSLILVADTTAILKSMFKGLSSGYQIFNSKGELLCYNGQSTCGGQQFMEFLNTNSTTFTPCEDKNLTLDAVLAQTYDINNQPVQREQFENTDYYIVSYWAKFMGGKRGYEDAVLWMEEELAKNTTDTSVTFIKINTDLQESWGLKAGEKVRLKIKQKDNSMKLKISELPYKNKPTESKS
ncbi:hypothetical protein [Mangrovimonas sp. YM274]|uniref:hypothetical protein n=1 Tax=Mangrovimonas sp. YM274 TaxID=3070660 RepID=UPI0027DC81AF|nr:hypothetical protein [Mangrovimonas sp. YM274]WMI69008.1 hypothetical protein RBH95_01240 [Mangrovimonas sp. YM274]